MPRPFLVGLLALASASGCILWDDLTFEGTSSGNGGNGASGDGGAGAGEGGCVADLETDSNNCGACGFVCDETACVAGACAQCVDLSAHGGDVEAVAVGEDGLVYFVQDDGAGGGSDRFIRTLPLDFMADADPGLNHPGSFGYPRMAVGTVGAHRVYVTGQLSTVVYACDGTSCLDHDVGTELVQLNGMAAVGEDLYFLAVFGQSLQRIAIDPASGVLTGSPVPQVTTYEKAVTGDGVVELFQAMAPPKLFWASHDFTAQTDGCVYRIDLRDLPSPQAPGLPCYSEPYKALGFVVASDGTVFAQEAGSNRILRISGKAPAVPVEFDTNATAPRAIDDAYLYVTDATSGEVRAIPIAGAPTVPAIAEPPATMISLTATHARYVVGSAGSHVCRWPKP